MDDTFATGVIRENVLAAWAASPARFRADANVEEDFALGGYRDRVIVELAQNAADAAAQAGAAGVVRFTLHGSPGAGERPVLVAANTGAALTAEGVASLATLRASAKRADATVGRFGVGFAAVLAVSDEPMLLSRTSGVRFSREDSAEVVTEAAATTPGLAEELRRRTGHVPALRLPFPADGEPPSGFDTAVVLPLRDENAVDVVRQLLAEVDDAFGLAFPDLHRIEIDVDGVERVLTDVGDRWHVHRFGGTWSEAEIGELFADRPTEERERASWSVVWALPRTGALPADVVRAPTPTDEPLALPALLLASLPLEPSRRHVAPGPLTDRLVAKAASGYAELVRERAEDGTDPLPLVPVGLPAGTVDGALRNAIVAELATTACLPRVEDGALLRPPDAVALDGPAGADLGLLAALAPIVSGLTAAPRSARAALDALGVRRLGLADLVDELAAVATAHPPRWWRELYAALASQATDPRVREDLGVLPVPLADGRVVRGARGLLVPGDIDADTLAVLTPYGLRVVHPDAAHPLLEQLGATAATARALLADGALRAAVADTAELDEPTSVVDAVLTLVSAAGDLAPGELAFLGELALTDADGELAPANALVLPDSPAAAVLDPEEFVPVDPELVRRWGPDTLEATGVARGLGLVIAADVALDALPDELADLPGLEDWAGTDGGTAGEVRAVRDLDFVTDWPGALPLFASDPALHRALVEPVRVVRPDGEIEPVPSYPAWWIQRHVRIDGQALTTLRDPDADEALAVVLDPPPDWLAELDAPVRSALGLPRHLAQLGAEGVAAVLDRLASTRVDVDVATALVVWQQLTELDEAVAAEVDPPSHVRVLDAATTRVVPTDAAVIVDAPMWRQRGDLGAHIVAPGPGAETLANLLDVPLATEVAAGTVSGGEPIPVPDAVRRLLPGGPEQWWEHDQLLVDGEEVDWWVDAAGRPHAATTAGLARALAWSAGRWWARHTLAVVLTEPDQAIDLLVDGAYE